MNKLVTIVAAATLLSSCTRIHRHRNSTQYQTPSYQYQSPQPAQSPPKLERQIEDACTNPKVWIRENDFRFANLTSKNFIITGYNAENRTPNYQDIRWVYQRGENFVITAAFPNELSGSTAMLMLSLNEEVLSKKFIPVGSGDNAFFFQAVDVSRILDSNGSGDYKLAWAFNTGAMNPDFKLALIQYIRLKD